MCIVWKTDWLVLSPTYCSQDQRNHSWKTYDSTLFNSFFTWIMKNVEKITEIAEVNHFFPQPGSLKWPCTYHNLVHLGNSTGEVGGSKRKIKPDQDAPKPHQPVGSHDLYKTYYTCTSVYHDTCDTCVSMSDRSIYIQKTLRALHLGIQSEGMSYNVSLFERLSSIPPIDKCQDSKQPSESKK